MKFSELFTKTRREGPKDETSVNAQLLTRGGFIFKNMAGVYSFLPLGVRVLDKIRDIIRDEMNKIGGQELYLNVLQDKNIWDKTGRWKIGKIENVMYQWQEDGKDFGLGFTHEEVVAQIGSLYIHSYKDLPKFVYQIQTKFRREARAQSGLLRNREFEMKDLYSLTRDEKELKRFYEECAKAYAKIFDRLGLNTIRTKAHGGVFSGSGSDEFQVISAVGEDTIYYCDKDKTAINKEIFDESQRSCEKCQRPLVEKRAIEVGNIFMLGTKFSRPLGLLFKDENGNEKEVYMGSYGIGIGRAMATVVEVHHDEKGILWPHAVAPFAVHLIALGDDPKIVQRAQKTYQALAKKVEVLFDDRANVSPGEKFADADLIGCPLRLVVSARTGERLEIKRRLAKDATLVSLTRAIDTAAKI